MQTTRRDFLAAGLVGAGAVSLGLMALAKHSENKGQPQLKELMGPLKPVRDEYTGLPLMLLPDGFRYRTFAWAGSQLSDGFASPRKADGMGRVHDDGRRVTLVRNHELRGSDGAFGAPETAYDVTGGGTTTLVFDLEKERLEQSHVSLNGTLMNCAGGVTPWGTWLTCEEAPVTPTLFHLPVPGRKESWNIENAKREHGFVFEVPADGVAKPEPIVDMGQFFHEAVAFDRRTGIAYMTEDTNPYAGFYRFISNVEGDLLAGGRLQMMRVSEGRDMRSGLSVGEEFPVEWVDIPNPAQGFQPENRDGDGVVTQGLAAGGSSFISLEGCDYLEGQVYFTSKYGGVAKSGAVYQYDIDREKVFMIYESPGHHVFSGPDNIIMSPRGSLVICEDRVSQNTAGQFLAGLTSNGDLFRFAQINPALSGEYGGHDLARTALHSEWAGATFSADGEWMFVNIFNPGATVAITGPWVEGLI